MSKCEKFDIDRTSEWLVYGYAGEPQVFTKYKEALKAYSEERNTYDMARLVKRETTVTTHIETYTRFRHNM